MLRHSDIWRAIDRLAEKHGLSASGLARRAGLDPTAFNKSKRKSPSGKPRWPGSESIAKILASTGETLADFLPLMGERAVAPRRLPLLAFAKAAGSGSFDEEGHPAGKGWEKVEFAAPDDPQAYALRVSGDGLSPSYRSGDVVVVSPAAGVRRGDRVVLKTRSGEILTREFVRQSSQRVEVRALNSSGAPRALPRADVLWMARIMWVRQ